MPRLKIAPLAPFAWQRSDNQRHCCHPGCRAVAEFPAPRRREDDQQHGGFCLEHARLHNEAWNYFADMSPEEIDYHRRQDMVGWRPSWPLGESGVSLARLVDPLGMEEMTRQSSGDNEASGGRSSMTMPATIRRALDILDLPPSVTLASLKARYKQLARRLHPDANGGNRRYEEQFRKVNEAYEQLNAFFDGHSA